MSKPVTVIRSIEDIAEPLDRRLVLAYLQTKYQVFSPSFDLKIGQSHPAFDLFLEKTRAKTWAFISPENPGSKILPPTENNRRCDFFLEKIKNLHLPIFEGAGFGEKSDWPPERSFLILNISAASAVELAKDFGQNAIVFGEKNGLAKLWWVV